MARKKKDEIIGEAIEEVKYYIVEKGETKLQISQKFKLTKEKMNSLNPNINWLRLTEGTKIRIK